MRGSCFLKAPVSETTRQTIILHAHHFIISINAIVMSLYIMKVGVRLLRGIMYLEGPSNRINKKSHSSRKTLPNIYQFISLWGDYRMAKNLPRYLRGSCFFEAPWSKLPRKKIHSSLKPFHHTYQRICDQLTHHLFLEVYSMVKIRPVAGTR